MTTDNAVHNDALTLGDLRSQLDHVDEMLHGMQQHDREQAELAEAVAATAHATGVQVEKIAAVLAEFEPLLNMFRGGSKPDMIGAAQAVRQARRGRRG